MQLNGKERNTQKILQAGLYVNFAKPKVLYYDVPNDAAAYGNDAGKSVRLDFGGFGDLWGIPGNVINVQTGEVIGEFVEDLE